MLLLTVNIEREFLAISNDDFMLIQYCLMLQAKFMFAWENNVYHS